SEPERLVALVPANAGSPRRPAQATAAAARARAGRLFEQDSDARSTTLLGVIAALVLAAAVAGVAIAFADIDAAVLCLAALGSVFVLIDYRVGVVLLILLMPIAPSVLFPHAMFGITGMNPLNLLLGGTLVSYVMHRASGSKRAARFLPRPLVWLYIAPFVV